MNGLHKGHQEATIHANGVIETNNQVIELPDSIEIIDTIKTREKIQKSQCIDSSFLIQKNEIPHSAEIDDLNKKIDVVETSCCIVGGGPAGMILGYLLARAGIDVVVLEKHVDFLRDFRGDTIHPSTLALMNDLGLLEEFLKQPHQKSEKLVGYIEDEKICLADFSHLKTCCPFIALMPQWNFLNFIAEQAKALPSFHLYMQAQVVALLRDQSVISGVIAQVPQGSLHVKAQLVIGADGRHSTVRELAGLSVIDLGAPIDVLWLRCSRLADDPDQVMGKFSAGKIFIMIDRGDYWQCAYIIPKGSLEEIKQRGLEFFRESILKLAPFLKERVMEVHDWDDVKLLTVTVNRLRQWFLPGLLCIGDAAHAMSPIGGVGINLAIQDAVAAANYLIEPLRTYSLSNLVLEKIQKRREFPTRITQKMQVLVQKRVIKKIIHNNEKVKLPWFVRLMFKLPFPRRIVAHMVGLGVRPERFKIKDF